MSLLHIAARVASRVAKVQWSGRATVTFPVLRWKHRLTGQLAAGKDPPELTPEEQTLEGVHEENPLWEEIEIDVKATGEGYYDPGQCFGAPENCYPPEGDLEVVEFENDAGLQYEQLTKQERDRLEEALTESIREERFADHDFEGDY